MSTATVETSATVGEWRCAECGRVFSRKQGLGRHMSETHGHPTTREKAAQRAERRGGTGRAAAPAPAPAPRSSGVMAGIEAEMRELVEPMRNRLTKLNGEIATRQAELVEMRKARTFLQGMLDKLEPTKAKKKATPRPRAAAGARANADVGRAAKTENIRAYLSEHAAELYDGFTATDIYERLRYTGAEPVASPEMVRSIFNDLRDIGLIRADRRTRGGGMAYMLVSQNGTTDQGGTDGGSQA